MRTEPQIFQDHVVLNLKRYHELIEIEKQLDSVIKEIKNKPNLILERCYHRTHYSSICSYPIAYKDYEIKVITDKEALEILEKEYRNKWKNSITKMSIRGFIKLRKVLKKQ